MRGIKDFFRVIYKNKQAFVGLTILVIFFFMATVGASLTKVDMTIQYDNRYLGPSFKHLLGTDYGGRDTFKQLVEGSRDVLLVGFMSAIFVLFIGFIVGAVSGVVGGVVDTVLMFISNLFITIPSFPILMIITALVRINSNLFFAVILSLFSWANLARQIRAQILSLKHRDYIIACRLMGLSTWHIMFKEIMPNLVPFIAMNFIFAMQNAINSTVGLIIIGLAPYSPTNWGMMLQMALQNSAGIFNPKAYYYLFSPIVCMGLFQMGCIFFASGLDEALNPRLRTQA
jgi:peptide/nickel transport system permease protein